MYLLRISLNYKGVYCFNPQTGKMIISRHVVHDENVFPFHFGKQLPYVNETFTHLTMPTSIPAHVIVNLPQSQAPTSTLPHDSSGSRHIDSPHDISFSSTSDVSHNVETATSQSVTMLPLLSNAQLVVILPIASSQLPQNINVHHM